MRHALPFRLWVLCFDDATYEILHKLALPQVHPILQRDFENEDEQLSRAKANRSQVEYYFTCTPSLIAYVLKNHLEVDTITYLDADLFFFSNPSPIYEELGDGSVLIVGHRFPPHLSHLEKYGIYNVGLLSFRRDDVASRCLHWWRKQCLEWCYDRVENGRFADQKYLDDWPTRFPGVVVLKNKGAGLAPWNVANYSLRVDNRQVLVDSDRLIFFHFHGLRQPWKWLYDPGLAKYGVRANSKLKQNIYGPYIRELKKASYSLAQFADSYSVRMESIRGDMKGKRSCSVARKIKNQLSTIKMLLQGQLLLVVDEVVT